MSVESKTTSNSRIIVALDVDNAEKAVALVTKLKDYVGVFKVGLELVNSAGMGIFDTLRQAGAERFFYDAKLHDIPNTVAGAMRGIGKMGMWCVTVHAGGGAAMLKAAVEAARAQAEKSSLPPPKIFAVTVLTSISESVLKYELEVATTLPEHVAHLAHLAQISGCDGVIAAPQEIETIRSAIHDPKFLIVTPGVRPKGAASGDQARVMTPGEAIRRGVDYLVIGRPIVAASDPVEAAQRINAEIASAL